MPAGVGILVHVDAVAAAGHVSGRPRALDADLVSVSSHKLGGPAGMGALIVRTRAACRSDLVGGEQERARRAGLENVAGAVGFGAAAAALARPGVLEAEEADARRRTDRSVGVGRHRRRAGCALFGDPVGRVPHIVCLGIDGVEAEPVLLGLDQAGIAAHSGSSCSSEALEPSPVLEAMGVDAERSLRLSVGWSTTGGRRRCVLRPPSPVWSEDSGRSGADRTVTGPAGPPGRFSAMRAIVCPELGPLDTLVVEEQEAPVPGEGQVVVDLRAAGVNFVDGLICQGTIS